MTLLGVIEPQVKPIGSEVSDRDTAPVKPFRAVRVIVEEADWPAFALEGVEAVMLKSGTTAKVKVAVVLWVSDALVPVIVTV